MTTKHYAEELADKLKNRLGGRLFNGLDLMAAKLLRTIPALEAEIEVLKAEANKWHQMYVERAVK